MAQSEVRFWLVDALEWQKECPTTFDVPDEWNRKHLKVGEWAKLIFAFPTEPEHSFERMWVRIEAVSEAWYGGALDNEPSTEGFISVGHRLRFEPRHIIDIRPRRMSLHPVQLE
jgi:hypothetical protein